MRHITFFVALCAVLVGCMSAPVAVDIADAPESSPEFFNSLSGQYMMWIECGGTDDIGELPVASFWGGEDDDWIGAAFAFWFPQGRCTGYPESCDISCISDESGLLTGPADYTPIDDVHGAGAPSAPTDPIASHGLDPRDPFWRCRSWARKLPLIGDPGDFKWVESDVFTAKSLDKAIDTGIRRIENGHTRHDSWPRPNYEVKKPKRDNTQCCDFEEYDEDADCEWTSEDYAPIDVTP